jgi:hypothetical protein
VAIVLALAAVGRWEVRRRFQNTPTDSSARGATTVLGVDVAIWIRFVIIGMLLGGTWVWNENQPPWIHAVRILVLVVIVGPLIRLFRQRRDGHQDEQSARRSFVKKWLLLKLTLVLTALSCELILEKWVSRTIAAPIVGLVLTVTVAVGAPLMFRWSRERRSRP